MGHEVTNYSPKFKPGDRVRVYQMIGWPEGTEDLTGEVGEIDAVQPNKERTAWIFGLVFEHREGCMFDEDELELIEDLDHPTALSIAVWRVHRVATLEGRKGAGSELGQGAHDGDEPVVGSLRDGPPSRRTSMGSAGRADGGIRSPRPSNATNGCHMGRRVDSPSGLGPWRVLRCSQSMGFDLG
jgi:hypothetical protein